MRLETVKRRFTISLKPNRGGALRYTFAGGWWIRVKPDPIKEMPQMRSAYRIGQRGHCKTGVSAPTRFAMQYALAAYHQYV